MPHIDCAIKTKYAVRITDGVHYRLFAVCNHAYLTEMRALANKSIGYGSSDWVTVNLWSWR